MASAATVMVFTVEEGKRVMSFFKLVAMLDKQIFGLAPFASIFGLTVQLIRVSSGLVALRILRTNRAEFRSFIRVGLLYSTVAV